ncbi:YbjQ family protein [Patescibacteria group bacterium]|nr:YbjQ family protein [Patescibacteria group bacterium]
MILTTSDKIPGKEIKETLGLVRGNTIRAKHIGKDILAGLRNIVGGEIKEYTEALDEARKSAVERMVVEAEKLEADAIVCVRFTTSQVMSGAAELLVYGTAVRLVK